MSSVEYTMRKVLRQGMWLAQMVCVWGALVGLSSCDRRPLEDPTNTAKVRVAINVQSISNVTCDIYNSKVPIPEIKSDMMRVLFFDPVNNTIAAESYISNVVVDADGNRSIEDDISVQPGNYALLVYNFDTESTMLRADDKFETIEAYTNKVSSAIGSRFSSRADGDEEDIVYQPDHLIVARNPNQKIPYHEGVLTINTEATSVVESYYLQIKVDGLQYVSSAQAILNGVVSSNRIGGNERVTSPASTLYFTLQKSDDKGTDVLATVFNTFGRADSLAHTLSITFDLQTTDGRTVTRDFDISKLFESENCIKHHWLLFDETIKIDPPAGGGGGFDPAVDDWDDEHHDIEL